MTTWGERLAESIGAAVKQRRKELGMTANQLADRTEELGHAINRVAISKLENGNRNGKLGLAELLILARALETSPATLLFIHDLAEVTPEAQMQRLDAQVWLSGIDPDLLRLGQLKRAEIELAEAQSRIDSLRGGEQ